MDYHTLHRRVLDRRIPASDGDHSARLWRIAENIQSHAVQDASDDRLLHLMGRIGLLCRGLARDIRSGHTRPKEAAILLDQLADIGDLSFEQWRRSS